VDSLRRGTIHPLVGITLFLGVLGILYTLFAHPIALFRKIVFVMLVIAAIYVFYHFIYKRRTNKAHLAYLKAVRQSKKLHPQAVRKPKTNNAHLKMKRPLRKRTTTTHLTVIDGKKGKKKNRASF
jgi:uncharacterized protein YacL